MKIRLQLLSASIGRVLLVVTVVAVLAAGTARPVAAATQLDIVGPPGSGQFGYSVTVLPNGNIVVADPYYDAGPIADVGAVYLHNGATGALISTLTGSTAGDQVGAYGVRALSNGNYVVLSPYWDNDVAANAGAATWANGTTGVSGVVSAANSLVGTTAGDQIGYAMTALSNGNYVVFSMLWDNGAAFDAGAVTWASGTTGIAGVVSAANSLVGGSAGDFVGYSYVTALSNGNYVVCSPHWHNGAVTSAGAVTWGNGATGIAGLVSAANSLVGSTAYDMIGSERVTELSNGNYVVSSQHWHNGGAADAGAVTWGNGTTGISGLVSAANSLVGGTAGDQVGYPTPGVLELSNGNYVVLSPGWHNGGAANAGAVTWRNGMTSTAGLVSASTSLVGSTADDQVGHGGWVTALSNGNYVVHTPMWDNGAVVDAGAATWGNGTTGVAGPVSAANSLVGSATGDQVGHGMTALSNGNYVVTSSWWDNGAVIDAGAATWGNGTTGVFGPVSAANSLVGSMSSDHVSYNGATALSNGNYVVGSMVWDDGAAVDAGAATWGNGTTGIAGPVSAANSLVGTATGNCVGRGVTALSNGNYVVASFSWDNGPVLDVGAVTWGNGTTGTTGVVSTANSLVGSTAGDQIGYFTAGVTALSNGNYVVRSPYWDNGAAADAGAVTWGNGTTGTVGVVSAANSLVGGTSGDQVGNLFLTAMNNGNYVVYSPLWDSGAATDAGAVTWGSGTTGIAGSVSAANSLVGSTADDQVGNYYVTELSNGDYVVTSEFWDYGAAVDAGAVTWASGLTGVAGPITADNSVRGTTASGGSSMAWAYDYANRQLVVGRPTENIVTLFRPFYSVSLPLVLKNW